MEFKKGKIPKWDGNNGKSIGIKSETELGSKRKLGFVPILKRQKVKYSCCRAK